MKQKMKQNRRNFPILPESLYFATAPWRAYFAALRFLLNHAAGLVATVHSVCLWALPVRSVCLDAPSYGSTTVAAALVGEKPLGTPGPTVQVPVAWS